MLRREMCGFRLRHPGAGTRLVGLLRGHGWERIILFPILQNEKEKRKKRNIAMHQAIEIFEPSAHKSSPQARVSNFLHLLLCAIQLRIYQTRIEYIFRVV